VVRFTFRPLYPWAIVIERFDNIDVKHANPVNKNIASNKQTPQSIV